MDSYEKKYKEIVGKIRKAYLYAQTDSTKAVLKEIIPELAESEDEKVIKEIIELVMQPTWKTEEEFHRRNVLCAWLENVPVTIDHEKREGFHLGYKACLERQVEQNFEMKTAEESLGISSDEYNKIVDECLFGEQKLTEFERGLFDMLTDISKPCTADCVKSHSEKLLSIARKMIALEQKPEENKGNIGGISSNSEWSKEDEIRLNTIINDITVDKSMCKYEVAKSICDEQINWLKSLKDRVQPKQEWSEEDSQYIDDAFTLIGFGLSTHTTGEVQEWLLSLKGRVKPQWKPSDEQMNNK